MPRSSKRRDMLLAVALLVGLIIALLVALAYFGFDVAAVIYSVAAAIRGENPWWLAIVVVLGVAAFWWYVLRRFWYP